MNFKPTRDEAITKLDNFIKNNLNEYAKLRNFDFGPSKRSNISCLSPYISNGVIYEYEIINKALTKCSFPKNEKFFQEVLWRIYWKGWLELKPQVWQDYLTDLKKINDDFKTDKKYLEAINGKTNIECFNDWVNELKENNYLHNHTRMWFASIWIFTLNLPWQLGAEFFMKYLYDGDAASNTLGWRWVAGIQTVGKHYLVKEWNIKKFTNNRYQNIKLNNNASPIVDKRNYQILLKNFVNPKILDNKILLLFDNNLSFENSDFKNYNFKKILIIFNPNETRKILLSKKTIFFKKSLIQDQLQRLKKKSINCETINIDELKKIDEKVYALYPSIGENLNFINENSLENIQFLYRKIDQLSWQYCNKGFFNFKNYIPKIINSFS